MAVSALNIMGVLSVEARRRKKGLVKMRTRLLSLLCAAAGFLSLAASESVAGNVNWSVSIFSEPLGRYGHWVERPGYGRCWYPAYVSSDWRPYCEGYWMWTNCGWYWVSDEQWAWATYHYGRWVYDSYYGWVWVPDTEWGPSWVSWREGDEYVGWAPLPPGAGFGPGGYVVVRDHPIEDRFFVFVQIGHFAEPCHRRSVIVNNTTIINKTVNITKITRVNNVVVNDGPQVGRIQKVSSRRLTEPPPRVAAEHRGAAQPKEATPRILKPSSGEEVHPPVSGEKTRKQEPSIIRGSPGTPPETSGAKGGTGKKLPEKLRIEPQPTQSQPPSTEKPERHRKDEASPSGKQPYNQNFGAKPAKPNVPVQPDSVQPKQRERHQQPPQQVQPRREERAAEKQGREEKPKKGEQGGD